MPSITNRSVSIATRWAVALVSLAVMTGCAAKVKLKPQANFLQNGTYRSKIETAPGKMSGLYLQLNGNGRFSMATMEGGCFIIEDWGVWSATQEELNLAVQKSRSRETCTSAWQTVQNDLAFHCSMRNVTDRSFQMLHDEIQQGTLWTSWERETTQGYADLERLRKDAGSETVTLDAGQDSDESPDKSTPDNIPVTPVQKP